MRWLTVLSLLVVCLVCLSVAQVTYDDCCLRYAKKLSQRVQKHAVRYRTQEMDGDCNLRAIIFTMKKGRQYCGDPNEKWVKDLMKYVEKKSRSKTRGRLSKG